MLLQAFPEWNTLLALFLGMVTILNPLAVVPTWLNLTVDRDVREKRILIRRIVKNVLVLLVFFLFLGRALLEFFGLTMVAIQFAGALYIMLTAINALLNQPKRLTDNALARDRERDDISFTPMAMPLLVGPGVMGLMMGFGDKFGYPWSSMGSAFTYAVILGFCLVCCLLVFVTLSSSKYLERILGHSGLYGLGRIMSFILLALGCQMLLRSIQTVVLSLSSS
jgi:multiple antibiotic resistance protein